MYCSAGLLNLACTRDSMSHGHAYCMKSQRGLSVFRPGTSRRVCVLSWNVVAFSPKVETALAATEVTADEDFGALLNDVASRFDGAHIGGVAPGPRKPKMT